MMPEHISGVVCMICICAWKISETVILGWAHLIFEGPVDRSWRARTRAFHLLFIVKKAWDKVQKCPQPPVRPPKAFLGRETTYQRNVKKPPPGTGFFIIPLARSVTRFFSCRNRPGYRHVNLMALNGSRKHTLYSTRGTTLPFSPFRRTFWKHLQNFLKAQSNAYAWDHRLSVCPRRREKRRRN